MFFECFSCLVGHTTFCFFKRKRSVNDVFHASSCENLQPRIIRLPPFCSPRRPFVLPRNLFAPVWNRSADAFDRKTSPFLMQRQVLNYTSKRNDAVHKQGLIRPGKVPRRAKAAVNRAQSRRFARASRIYFAGIISGMACRSNRR